MYLNYIIVIISFLTPLYCPFNAYAGPFQNNYSAKKSYSSSPYTTPLHKNIAKAQAALDGYAVPLSSYLFQLDKDIHRLNKKFAHSFKGWRGFPHKYLTINIMHILGMELTPMPQYIKMGGFHHDQQGVLQKNGTLQLKNVKRYAKGFYKADIWINGIQFSPPKTFFPHHWSREKIVQAIANAYNNALKKGGPPVLQPNGNYALRGTTNDGISIQMYISKTGKIITAFPIF